MNIKRAIKEWLFAEERSTTRHSSDPSWAALFGYTDPVAGVTVNTSTAEGISAVYGCVGIISESVARLPLHVYQRDADARIRQRDHYIEKLFNGRPNARSTAFELKESLVQHLLLRGNGYALIKDMSNGEVIALELLHPDLMSVELLPNGRLRYTYSDPKGGSTVYSQDNILHLRGRSDDGILGKTPISVARETLGLALAEQRHGSYSFANGTRLSGVLQTDKVLGDKAFDNLKKSWNDSYGGLANTGNPAILEGGLKWQPLSMSLDDSELVKNRRFSFEEVARLFRVPPVLIGDLSHANYSNSVELMRHFLVTCLGPHLKRFEESVMRSLMPDTERRLYCEFETKALLQSDTKTRFEAYSFALDPDKGWMTRDEVRKAENLPPMPPQQELKV